MANTIQQLLAIGTNDDPSLWFDVEEGNGTTLLLKSGSALSVATTVVIEMQDADGVAQPVGRLDYLTRVGGLALKGKYRVRRLTGFDSSPVGIDRIY